MKEFKVRVDELVQVWQQTYLTVKAESMEDVERMIENKSILNTEWINVESGEFYLETTENLDWDFNNVEIFEIEKN